MNYSKIISFIFCAICINSFSLCTAQTYSVSGKITDFSSGEYLAGATVYNNQLKSGTFSNSYGYFSIITNKDNVNLLFSFVGYENKTVLLDINSDTIIDITLCPLDFKIDEVIVNANTHKTINEMEMSLHQISSNKIKLIPGVAGEIDVFNSIKSLPGVNNGNEGANNISIRGGSFDQNLIILDDAVLYNPNHVLSLFSTFNPDIVKSIDFYKTDYPIKYGGRLSSVIDIRTREGNNKVFKVEGGVGILASRILIEGPIIKEKASFILSARYSYASLFANGLYSLNSILPDLQNYKKGNEVKFYDLNFKFNYKFSSKDQIYISSYLGNDYFYFKNFNDNYKLSWGNASTSVRWNHSYNKKLFSNSTLAYSNYSYSYLLKADTRNFIWKANMKDFQFKTDYDYYLGNNSKFTFGIFLGHLNTLPGKILPQNEESITETYTLDRRKSIEMGAYSGTELRINNFTKLKVGIRYTSFSQLGTATIYNYNSIIDGILDSINFDKNEIIKTYNTLEPRILLNIKTSQNSSLKLSYTNSSQFLHLLTNSSIGLPTDIWLPSGYHLKPLKAHQYAVGFFKIFPDTEIESSIQFYYKKMNNIIDFKDNANLFLNKHIENQIISGYATSCGSEIFIVKKSGFYKWQVAYTLSKTSNYIKGINNDNKYPPSYDKRHNLKLSFSYDFNKKWALTSLFSFVSGSNITVPKGSFQYYGASFFYFTERNGYKVPAFHQLDLSLHRKVIHKSRLESEWIFSINNIYNRKNVFTIYIRQNKYSLNEAVSYKLYLYGFFPSITYNFKF